MISSRQAQRYNIRQGWMYSTHLGHPSYFFVFFFFFNFGFSNSMDFARVLLITKRRLSPRISNIITRKKPSLLILFHFCPKLWHNNTQKKVSIQMKTAPADQPRWKKKKENLRDGGICIRKQDRERAFDRTLSRRSTAARLVSFSFL